MLNWNEIRTHVRQRYRVAEDREHDFTLVFEYSNGRRQAVVVSTHEAMGQRWCDFSSACCRIDQLSAVEAARRNFALAAGSIALDGDVYVVRYSVLLPLLDPEHFELAIHVVTATASRVESDLLPNAGGQAVG